MIFCLFLFLTIGNGYIDYDEFESFALKINMVKRQSSEDPDFRAAFEMMDRNKDGYLDKSELKYFMDKFGNFIKISLLIQKIRS